MDARDKLYDILWNGLQGGIYEADESLVLVKEIGRHASAIKEAKYGFDHLFETAILAVNRIYEKLSASKHFGRDSPLTGKLFHS